MFDVRCPNCDKFYKWRKNLYSHMKFECRKPIKFFCTMCKYRTHYPSYYKKHMFRAHEVQVNGEGVRE